MCTDTRLYSMCGIIGYQGNFEVRALRAGMSLIAHRGPDDSGVFLEPRTRIGLGHQRLAIIDLSPLGHQPMSDPSGQVTLVFNGEIYNFRELRAELESQGAVFRGKSDTEVIAHLYVRLGEAMLPRLNGIFSLAIWDSIDSSLFVARDALGVKPLYYSCDARGFAFCSELKGLLELVPEARQIDPSAIDRYLTFLWCPGDGTPLRGIHKLCPGESVLVRNGAIARRRQWYRLPAARGVVSCLTEQEAIDGTVAHVTEAVRRQLVADVPVGSFLSGGLDSSCVVALAKRFDQDIRCFTIEILGGGEDGIPDDLPYAERVANHLGVRLERIQVESKSMASDIEQMVFQLDEPLADPAPLNALYISSLARKLGYKVLLSGAGGDDLFSGYRRHRAIQADRLLAHVPRGVRRAAERLSMCLGQGTAFRRRLARFANGASLNGDERIANYFRWIPRPQLAALYSTEFRDSLGASRAEQPLMDLLATIPKSIDPLGRMLALEQRFFLADHNLTYTDKMSMAVGVEARVPFLDLDLVEFAQRIPSHLKQRGSVGKWVLKRAMEPYLPRDVIYRPKAGFGAPLRRWMRGELSGLVEATLGEDSLRRRGIFDPIAIRKMVIDNSSGRIDASYTLLSAMCIEIWCRKFIDRQG